MSKEEILQKVGSYDILNYYLQPHHNHGRLMAGKNISNPFLAKKQETPSFNIYPALPSHEWMYKDFATGDEGSCFDLVMKLFNLSFPDALKKVATDFTIESPNFSVVQQNKPTQVLVENQRVNPAFSFTSKPFTQKELAYWNQFGITPEVLNNYKVRSLSEFTTTNKEGKPYTSKCKEDKFMFAYQNGGGLKVYKPLDEKQFRFQHLGNKDSNFIFGWEQLPNSGELVFITGGEKDVMTLASHGFNAITLNSETASLDNQIAKVLNERFSKVVVLYDNDETGIKQSQKLVQEHQLHAITLPEMPDGKDISDFFAIGNSLESFNSMVTNLTQSIVPEVNFSDKVFFSAVELMSLGNIEPKYLMAPIFPQKGTAVLAGKPDTGKSQFARQLCIQVATGVTSFLGFDLCLKNRRAIYVATEDYLEATTFLLSKQINGLNQQPNENLRFLFADTMDQLEIIAKLESELTIYPADLIVIDSFGDVFKGHDTNNNMAMRNTVKLFDKIANQFSCLILFIHHINKGAYRQAPGQEHIQGGAGLTQKVRLGIQLSEGEGNTRYFTVVKGNYCPKEYKQNAMVLEFSESNFLFSNTGNLIPTDKLGAKTNEESNQESVDDLEAIADEIFGGKILSYTKFTSLFCELTGKKIASAKRAIPKLLDWNVIVNCQGGYRLTTPEERGEDSIMVQIDEIPI